MNTTTNQPFSLSAIGNQFALLGIIGILSFAFFDQLYYGELPCPLCLMQRMGFVIVGLAFAMNVRFGEATSHYGLAILGCLVGMCISMRQVLIHIMPGDTGYGSPFLGIHFYTWAFIGFMGILVGIAVLLMLPRSNVKSKSPVANALILIYILIVFGNLLSTLLECGGGACADDPVRYDGWISFLSMIGLGK